VERVRKAVEDAGMSCAIGWCVRLESMDLETLFRIADDRMYEEKQKYYSPEG